MWIDLYWIIGVAFSITLFTAVLYYTTRGRNATFEETQDFLFDEPKENTDAMENAIMILITYWKHGTWCFTDANTGLVDEAFVAGADKQISYLVKKYKINNPEAGFKILISATWFPDSDFITHLNPDEYGSGNYYRLVDGDVVIDGWYCSVLLMYFKTAPEKIYCKVENL